MRKIRDVLRLSADGMSKRKIAISLSVGATAAGDFIRRAPIGDPGRLPNYDASSDANPVSTGGPTSVLKHSQPIRHSFVNGRDAVGAEASAGAPRSCRLGFRPR